MFMKKILLKFTTLFLGLSLVTACVGFRSNMVPTVNKENVKLKNNSTTKKNIFINWNYSFPAIVSDKQALSLHKRMFSDNLKLLDCCTITDNKNDADIVMNLTIDNKANSASVLFSVITGLSLYAIPSWIESKINLKVSVQKNKKSYDYELSDSVTIAQWLPFIVMMPFKDNALKAEENMDINLYRNLFLKMDEDGVFSKN